MYNAEQEDLCECTPEPSAIKLKYKDAKAAGKENGKHRRGKFGQHPEDCPHICCTKNKKQLF